MVSTPMMPTMISAGTPYSFSARASAAAFACQKRTPARMRTGSTKRLRYTPQFLAVPWVAGVIRRGTWGRKRAWAMVARTQSGGRSWRAAMSAAICMASGRSP
jgi:hypothetical protein